MRIKCLNCFRYFRVTNSRTKTAKYCSVVCRAKFLGQLQKNKHGAISCQQCSLVFYQRPSRMATYCSAKCRAIGVGKKRTGVPMSQEAIKNISKAQRGKPKLSLRGTKHWNWKGGKSKNRHKGIEYIGWRKAVFERDKFICQNCGQGGYLNAHHLKSWASFPDLRFTLDNGITVCVPCHAKLDSKYSKLIYGQLKGGGRDSS